MNIRLFISQPPKGDGNNHKTDAGEGWWQNFPFVPR
jgi:hypothetical protein